MRIRVRVPATSANLGPGFDSFGLALDLWNEITVDTDAAPGVTWEGEGAQELPTDGTDLISAAVRRACSDAGMEPPAMALHGVNRIPLERGLGSSSASAVAGVAAGIFLAAPDQDLDLGAVFTLAAEFEGHPDNAAPAVYGGLTVVYGSEGPPLRLTPAPNLRPVALVPTDVRLPTEAARQALPAQVSLGDAIFNASHAAGLIIALTDGDERLLHETLRDRLHQDVRLALVPTVREVFERLRDQQIPVCVSGAGPTLLAFEGDDVTVEDPGEGWRILRPQIAAHGVEIITEHG